MYFGLTQVPGPISMDASVKVNLTDPNGHATLYDIPVGRSMGQGERWQLRVSFLKAWPITREPIKSMRKGFMEYPLFTWLFRR